MANYHDRLMDIRRQRIERRAGKRLIHQESEMLRFIDANKVPTMIQHCVLKVMKKVPGNDKEKFLSAFNICSATFSRYDYTRAGTMNMTGRGTRRNRRHQREKEASSKKSRYNALVERLWRPTIKRIKEDAKGDARNDVKDRMAKIKARRKASRK